MDDYENLNHSVWDCKYHVVFIPKYRRKTFEVDPVFWTRGLGGISGLLFLEESRNHGKADATES